MIRQFKKYHRHVKRLCDQHNISLSESGNSEGYARMLQRRIIVPKIVDQRNYLTALHEIGHFVSWDNRDENVFPDFLSTKPYILFEEYKAWKWALDNSIERIRYANRIDALRALHSYHRGVDCGEFKWAIFPPKNHHYWELIREYETHCLHPR